MIIDCRELERTYSPSGPSSPNVSMKLGMMRHPEMIPMSYPKRKPPIQRHGSVGDQGMTVRYRDSPKAMNTASVIALRFVVLAMIVPTSYRALNKGVKRGSQAGQESQEG